ncbi:MAG TPA: bifunctional demethylmenaquinone methyltransferase/2-methoxy-6-polyprenyl-1,4-benzoquinol methylase UbiE [Vicinamibacterales bacterium]|jgi:demethylmenaquinone methyltransferase/2-methoxy-6-polyprenyl-1,4-benzoquinol methylase|nr:bifunctional demethylmenaquinone methyltransferase/2-methoxy-6-polyprenyl-1,4-benzoquinol methylase UbiE [Vicinamibacterales bacterium]
MTDISKSPARIAGMFDAIAGRYDFLNHLLSAGLDRRWRGRAIRSLRLTGGERVLDLCTGTGDLAIAAARARPPAARVVGVDFSGAMLDVGAHKLRSERLDARIAMVRGDATRVPLGSASVEAVTIGFGIRNVEQMDVACAEVYRVLKPGGRLAILEFAVPTLPVFGAVYGWYVNRALPRIGRALSRDDSAYAYLPASIGAFASPDEFVKILRQTGFGSIFPIRLMLGSVILYTAQKKDGE